MRHLLELLASNKRAEPMDYFYHAKHQNECTEWFSVIGGQWLQQNCANDGLKNI